MGVFSDWESPRPPLADDAERTQFSNSVIADLSKLFEKAFALGFKASKIDRGHLLFAAWNALGGRCLWNPQDRSERQNPPTWDNLLDNLQHVADDTEMNITKVLTFIRDDMCQFYVDMQVHAGRGHTLPATAKLTQSKDKASATTVQIRKKLKAVVSNGERALSTLLEVKTVSPELFASLEAIAHFISFGVASYTKPSDADVFSVSRAGVDHGRRHRFDSLGSDKEHSDQDSMDSDSEDDPATRIRERLQAACADFGAAPTHPDWLDTNCSLLFDVPPSDALEVARTAVGSLTNLLSTCQARYCLCLQKGLKSLRITQHCGTSDDRSNMIARKLFVFASRYGIEGNHPGSLFSSDDDNDGYRATKQLASLFNIDLDSLEIYVSGSDTENLDETKTAWCPNSTQRIVGRYQEWSKDSESPWLSGPSDSACSGPELRVDKQWEVLLATSLAAACRDVCHENEAGASSDTFVGEAREAFLEADFW